MKNFHKLIKEICEEENIKCSILSKDWIIMLEKEHKIRFISGYKFDLNNHGFGNVIDDKYATFEVLKEKKVPIIEHNILFNQNNKNDYAKESNNYAFVENFFKEHQQSIVLKANDSTCGNEVYHLTNINEISKCLNRLFAKSFSISVCPFYDIKAEYRLIMLKDKCVAMYGKKRPIVVGDGKKTIRELLLGFNYHYFKDKLSEEEYNKILNKNEIYEYGWQFNLSKGAIPFEVSNLDLKNRLLNIALKVSSLFSLGFCSIDIVETQNNELLVMELNSGVMMENYMQIVPEGFKVAKEIYKEAINEMFKN